MKDLPRIAILGAGPIGLEAALYARRLKYPVQVFERGQVGEHWLRWGHVRLFSPFSMNTTALGRAAIKAADADHAFPADDACITGKEHRTIYLLPLAQLEELREVVHADTTVLKIGRQSFLKGDEPGASIRARQPLRLLVHDGKKGERIEEADIVLDCTGTYGQHRWLGAGGVPAVGELAAEPNIVYSLEDVAGERKNHYAGKNILVVGSGYSAATTVCQLATLAESNPATWVIWLARGQSTQPIKRITGDLLRERDRLAVRANTLATRADGNVEFHSQGGVEWIESFGQDRGFRVTGRCAGEARTWDVERIIANVGYSPDATIYRELQVHEHYATLGPMKLAASVLGQKGQDCLKLASPGAEAMGNPEPNFYILGAKSFGRISNFLLRNGFEQIRDVFRLITGNAGLDLYKNK
jgi:thioredoxin reductase